MFEKRVWRNEFEVSIYYILAVVPVLRTGSPTFLIDCQPAFLKPLFRANSIAATFSLEYVVDNPELCTSYISRKIAVCLTGTGSAAAERCSCDFVFALGVV